MSHPFSKTDSQLQQDVLNELRWNTRVEAAEIGVEVQHGTVTLSGTTSSWAKRLAAQDAAHRVSGVLDVANDIEVKPAGTLRRDDTAIAQAARHALEWSVLVPHSGIRTTVSGGVVTIEGEVQSWAEHEDAEAAVRNLYGVIEVRNRLDIHPTKVAHDIRRALEAALARHASREIGHVDVSVTDGVATLSGDVESWSEKQRIVGVAKGTRGVRAVDDHLRIRL